MTDTTTPAPAGLPTSVTVPWREYRALVADAGTLRLLNSSPHVAELLAEWIEWDRRRTQIETSNAISAAVDWRAVANAPTYAELARRRTAYTTEPLTPEQIRARARASWAHVEERITARRTAA